MIGDWKPLDVNTLKYERGDAAPAEATPKC